MINFCLWYMFVCVYSDTVKYCLDILYVYFTLEYSSAICTIITVIGIARSSLVSLKRSVYRAILRLLIFI